MKKRNISVLLPNLRSMHNIGSIFRTADGAGVNKIYLTGLTACPPRKEIGKTALGAEKSVPWEYHPDPLKLLKSLKKEGAKIIALERSRKSVPLKPCPPGQSFCLILGNEVEGVDASLLRVADRVISIPMRGKKESLNVAVAFGIAIYTLIP